LAALRAHPLTAEAQVIGQAIPEYPGKVILRTAVGGGDFWKCPSVTQFPAFADWTKIEGRVKLLKEGGFS